MTAAHDTQALARAFHDAHERLAPSFGYETRKEKGEFDPLSPNGMLIIAVMETLASRLQEQEGQPALSERTPKDYAIEHAEYMAVAAERLSEAVNLLAVAHRDEHDDPDIERAQEAVDEGLRAVRDRVHEFRKRRDRATLAAGSQAVQVPGWRPTDDEIRQAWDDLQKREEAALQALRAERIGSTCAACGVGKLAANGNGYNYFERCDSCWHVPFYDENGVDMIVQLTKRRAAAPLQPLAGGEVGNG